VFRHESGIHCARLKKTLSCPPTEPEIIGRQSTAFVAGPHSGRKIIAPLLAEAVVHPSARDTQRILREIREQAIAKQETLSNEDLVKIYNHIGDK
jgi:isopropylmalate/homocitrate/citramalate synthase